MLFAPGASTINSKLPGHTDLRTEGPRVISTMTLSHPIFGKGHKIDSVSLTFRYLAGYDSGPGKWPVLSIDVVDVQTGKSVKSVYTSAPLDKYKFDSGDPYSPPIHAGASGLGIDNDGPLCVLHSVLSALGSCAIFTAFQDCRFLVQVHPCDSPEQRAQRPDPARQ